MTRPDPSPVLARRPPPDAPHVALPRTPFADDEDGDDIDGEGFAFALPDIDALIAGPLPSLGPDDLTFIATIDDLDKLPTATPASSAPPTSPGGMLSSPRSSFPPGAFSFATSSRAGCPDGAAERAGLAPWVPRWSVDESVHPGRPTGGVPPPAAAARPPPDAQGVLDDERGAMRAAVRANPRYPKLLDAYFACRRVGADATSKASLARRRRQLLREATEVSCGTMRAALDACVRRYGAELDEFMDNVTDELTAYAEELGACFDEVDAACREAEARVAATAAKKLNALNVSAKTSRPVSTAAKKSVKVEPNAERESDSDTGGSDEDEASAWVRRRRRKAAKESKIPDTREDDLRKSLKRKYASSILALKDEFLKKTKKGKLPSSATKTLKEWWLANLLWPYPSEDAKRALMKLAGLNQTQINNWFINQRKRHWHRLFDRDEAQPISETEARHMILEKYGNVEAFLEVARAA